MVDEGDNRSEPIAPRPLAPDVQGPDPTIRLDIAIAGGSLSLPGNFGRYRVASRIGIGGFASVYSAFDPELDSLVAIKVLAENHSANATVRKRFVAEARVARRLGSDRLISVFDLGETDDGRPFVVMELAERGTLRQRLVKTGRPSLDDLLRLIDELAECMTAVHGQGVVHRDIKPSNLLFRATNPNDDHEPTHLIHDDERIVLGDLGLARDISDGASAVTVGGGTEGYMAPEQADPRGKADYRADIYSATVVLAELTTGRHPQRLDLPSADISTEVLEALSLSLSIDREHRPPDAASWRDRLHDAYRRQAQLGEFATPTGPLTTDPLDPTRIRAPYPYNGDPGPPTDVPPSGMAEPVSFAGRPSPDPVPPPPPSLPLDPSRQPPPPRLPRPAATAPSADDPPAASPSGERTAVPDRAQAPNGSPPRPGDAPIGGPGDTPMRPTHPRRAVHRPAATTSNPPGPPAQPTEEPGGTAQAAPVPDLGPGEPGPAITSEQATGRPPPIASPGGRPGSSTPQTPLPGTGRGPAGGPPVVVPPKPKAARRRGRRTTASAPPAVTPPVPATQGDTATKQSRKHLKTAARLAKLERKQNRRLARKARRRRRRLRVVNAIFSLIRGTLAALIAWLSGLVITAAALGVELAEVGEALNQHPGAQVLLLGGTLMAFLWGLAYFPFPRSYEI